jgi:hypothetical protein
MTYLRAIAAWFRVNYAALGADDAYFLRVPPVSL